MSCDLFVYIPTGNLNVTTSLIATTGSECSKCGTTKKSGKHSCCAPGGAWFKNCGDAGDKTFDHTWAEGIHACKDYGSSVPEQALLETILHYADVIACQPKTSQSRSNTSQQQTLDKRLSAASNTGYAERWDFVRSARAAVFICVWFIG